MSESIATVDLSKKLEAIVVSDPDFQQLEKSFGAFCPFEALGVVNAEIRHAAFLRSLLDPFRPHGYGTELLRSFLMVAVRAALDAGIDVHDLTPLRIHLMEFDDAEIRREWQAIDLLIVLRSAKIVIAIELKIDATQGHDQLRRYRKIVKAKWPGKDWKHIFVFLTKRDEAPDDEPWIPLRLSDVADEFESLTDASGADPRARDLLKAYLSMLRRHHMENEKLNNLAEQLWMRHPEALEFLMEHRPNVLGALYEDIHKEAKQIAARLTDACKATIEVDSETKAYIRFAVKEWDQLQGFRSGEGWTPSGRLILFELSRSELEVKISVILGPGPEDARKRLFEALKESDIRAPGTLAKKWKWLRSSVVLLKLSDDSIEMEDQRNRVVVGLEDFFRDVVPKFQAAFANLKREALDPL